MNVWTKNCWYPHEFWRVYSRHLSDLNRLFGAIATAPEHLAFLHQTFSSGESCADGAVKKEAAQRILGGWRVAGGGFSSKVIVETEAGRGRGRGASGAATGGFTFLGLW